MVGPAGTARPEGIQPAPPPNTSFDLGRAGAPGLGSLGLGGPLEANGLCSLLSPERKPRLWEAGQLRLDPELWAGSPPWGGEVLPGCTGEVHGHGE